MINNVSEILFILWNWDMLSLISSSQKGRIISSEEYSGCKRWGNTILQCIRSDDLQHINLFAK